MSEYDSRYLPPERCPEIMRAIDWQRGLEKPESCPEEVIIEDQEGFKIIVPQGIEERFPLFRSLSSLSIVSWLLGIGKKT